jgi:hypothetical protein
LAPERGAWSSCELSLWDRELEPREELESVGVLPGDKGDEDEGEEEGEEDEEEDDIPCA